MRVFVNATPIDVAAGATALDCVRVWRAKEADAVAAGGRVITDSRGLAIANETLARAGSIYRTIPNRAAGASTSP